MSTPAAHANAAVSAEDRSVKLTNAQLEWAGFIVRLSSWIEYLNE